MKKTKIYLLLPIILILFSCIEETEIGNDKIDFSTLYKKIPVVLSNFSTDSIVYLKLSTTEPSFMKENNVEKIEVEHPVIKSLNNSHLYSLEQSSANENIYFAKIKLTEGTAYQIEIEFPGYTNTRISAIDTIPFSSKIIKGEFKSEARKTADNLMTLVRIEVLPSSLQSVSYYELSVVTTITDSLDYDGLPFIDSSMLIPSLRDLYSNNPIIADEDYYPSVLQFGAFPPTHLFFKKETNKDIFPIDFYYDQPTSTIVGGLSSNTSTTHIYSHRAIIYLKTISYSYYQYHVSRLKQFYSRIGDPLYGVGEPVNVYSNIENGTGIFASYTSDSINYIYQKGNKAN